MEEDYEILKKYFIEKEKENIQLKEELESIKSKNEGIIKSRNNFRENVESGSFINNLTTNCQENKLNMSEENIEGVQGTQVLNQESNSNPINFQTSPILAEKKLNNIPIPNLKSTIFKREIESDTKIRSKSEISIRKESSSPPAEVVLNISGNLTENQVVNISNIGNTSRSKVSSVKNIKIINLLISEF
jgi:hypothetical protein